METTLETECKHEWQYILPRSNNTSNQRIRKCMHCGETQINYFVGGTAGNSEMWVTTFMTDWNGWE